MYLQFSKTFLIIQDIYFNSLYCLTFYLNVLLELYKSVNKCLGKGAGCVCDGTSFSHRSEEFRLTWLPGGELVKERESKGETGTSVLRGDISDSTGVFVRNPVRTPIQLSYTELVSITLDSTPEDPEDPSWKRRLIFSEYHPLWGKHKLYIGM